MLDITTKKHALLLNTEVIGKHRTEKLCVLFSMYNKMKRPDISLLKSFIKANEP